MNRRHFLQCSLAALAAPAARAARLDASALGANTAVTGYGFFDAVELIRRLGFPLVEIHTMGSIAPVPGRFPGFEFDRLSSADKKKMRDALRGFSRVTAHLPYTDLHTFSPFAPIREFSRQRVETAIDGAAHMSCDLVVLHAERAPLEETWNERLALYRGWGDRAKKLGMTIAIETGFPDSLAGFVRLIRELDHSHIGATLDVGHQSRFAELVAKIEPEQRGTPAGIRAYNDMNIELVEKLGSKLFHLHIHDIEPDTWAEHKPLVHGFVDYPRLIAKLREIGYSGPLMFEIGGDPAKMPQYLADAKRKLEGWLA